MESEARITRIEAALGQINDHQRDAVQALLDNPGANAQKLSEEMNSSSNTWQLVFGSMCKEHEANLWPAVIDPKTRKPFYSGMLAEFCDDSRGFTMKPEAVEGFRKLGMRQRTSP